MVKDLFPVILSLLCPQRTPPKPQNLSNNQKYSKNFDYLNLENFLRTNRPSDRPTFWTIEAPLPELKNKLFWGVICFSGRIGKGLNKIIILAEFSAKRYPPSNPSQKINIFFSSLFFHFFPR